MTERREERTGQRSPNTGSIVVMGVSRSLVINGEFSICPETCRERTPKRVVQSHHRQTSNSTKMQGDEPVLCHQVMGKASCDRIIIVCKRAEMPITSSRGKHEHSHTPMSRPRRTQTNKTNLHCDIKRRQVSCNGIIIVCKRVEMPITSSMHGRRQRDATRRNQNLSI